MPPPPPIPQNTQQDADPAGWWGETFLGHADSKPKGPEAISLDLGFPGAKHVYGIPERATHLALAPTAGAGVTSEPYRWGRSHAWGGMQARARSPTRRAPCPLPRL